MNLWLWLALALTLAVTIYLLFALLRAEDFA
jgi:K+-transporting ATPase KdpF subunit